MKKILILMLLTATLLSLAVSANAEIYEAKFKMLIDECIDYKTKGDFHRALESGLKAIKIYDSNGPVMYCVGASYKEIGKLSEGLSYLLKAKMLIEQEVSSNRTPKTIYALMLAEKDIGETYILLGQYNKAIQPLLQANDFSKQVQMINWEATTYLDLGIAYKRLGNRNMAERYLENALTTCTANSKCRNSGFIEAVNRHLSDPDIQLDTEKLKQLADDCWKHLENKNFDAAIKAGEEFLSIYEKNPGVTTCTGRAYLLLGIGNDKTDIEKAVALLTKALAIFNERTDKDRYTVEMDAIKNDIIFAKEKISKLNNLNR